MCEERRRHGRLLSLLFYLCFQLLLPVIKVVLLVDVPILIIRLVGYAEVLFINNQFQFSNIEMEHVCQTIQL